MPLEQDADMVLFIHRPEYYGLEADEAGNSTQGKAEIIIAKHRNGKVGSVTSQIHWQTLAKFTDADSFESGGNTTYDAARADSEPNNDFGAVNKSTVIRGSRMNDIDEDPFWFFLTTGPCLHTFVAF